MSTPALDGQQIRYFPDIGFTCQVIDTTETFPVFYRHNEIEYGFFNASPVRMQIGSTTIEVTSGQTFLFWGSQPHRVFVDREPFQRYIFNFPLGMFIGWKLPERFQNTILSGHVIIDTDRMMNSVDQLLFPRWAEDLRSRSAEVQHIIALEIESRVRRIAWDVGSFPSDARSDPAAAIIVDTEKEGTIQEVYTYIASHYQEDISAKDIAKAVRMHPNYLVSLFKKHSHIGVKDFMLMLRVAHAQRLLATTDLKVIDVALEAGFNTVSSFYNTFTRKASMTPLQFRRMVAQHKNPISP
jgi:AraC-like DNA-binding protein